MEPQGSVRYACGIVSVCSSEADHDETFWEAVSNAIKQRAFAFATLFFSKARFDPTVIRDRMAQTCPRLRYAATSTAGEIAHQGLSEGGIVAVLYPEDSFTVSACRIDAIATLGIEAIVERVTATRGDFVRRLHGNASLNTFALCFIDGMSFAEEQVTAALHWALDDIPMVGGSAGDDMNFKETSLILDGEIRRDCAILILLGTRTPFHIFKTDNFVPTDNKLVVTRSDPSRRIVHEFNAAPAAEEYARMIGIDPGSLSPMSFASHPLVVRVGGEYYCRSVQKMNADASLSFYCAIDDGIVLTVAEPTGMARTTAAAFEYVRRKIGTIDLVLGFDCVLRQVDARNRQVTHALSRIYRDNHVIGFNTYGEQFISMHLNQTFTGIAFAAPPVRP